MTPPNAAMDGRLVPECLGYKMHFGKGVMINEIRSLAALGSWRFPYGVIMGC